jgi:hypothetical protein
MKCTKIELMKTSKGITFKLTPEANEQIKRFKKIANYVKDYSEQKPFYVNKMLEMVEHLSDEEIIQILKSK